MEVAPSAASVLHAVPGRVRLHLDRWPAGPPGRASVALAAIPGVVEARARPATGNVVLRYDPAVTGPDAIVAAIAQLSAAERTLAAEPAVTAEPAPAPAGPVEDDPRFGQLLRAAAGSRRVRLAVRGLDRDPRLARRLIERLQARPDVRRVQVSATTGRALVELSGGVIDAEDLLADLTEIELPDEPGQDLPRHPLDPIPLVQSASRTVGASAGLAVLGVRALAGRQEPVFPRAVGAAAAIGIVEGLPPVQRAIRAALGLERAELVLGVASAVALTASAVPLGLALTAVGGLRVLTEVQARRNAWRAYEARLGDDDAPVAGDTVRVAAGERIPLRCRVIEGAGVVAGADGLPDRCSAGATIDAGARVVSGALVVELLGHASFTAPERPAPVPQPLPRRYAEAFGIASLAHAVVTLALTRSPTRALTAVLLVNPRPAMIGADMADAGASARVLRAGATIVGTRPERVVHRPNVLVLERPRVATDGFEVARVVPLASEAGAPLAQLVNAAVQASGGSSGEVVVDGGRYRLTSAVSLRGHPARAAMQERGEHAVLLRHEDDPPLALVALRPRPAPGLDALVETCRRRGTRLVMVEGGDRFAGRAVARRAGAELVLDATAADVIAQHQRDGALVGVVVDSSDGAPALAAADLGIGLTSGLSGHFPARADVLAPDLSAVAAIIETGARRDRAGTAAVVASLVANGVGLVDGLRGEAGIARASRATYLAALAAIGAGWVLLSGGTRSRSVTTRLSDPHPERWGEEPAARVLDLVGSRPDGLTPAEAAARAGRRGAPPSAGHPLVRGVAAQLRSPLTAVLGAGASLSLVIGATADVPIILAVIAANAAIGAWQERQASRATEELARLGAPTAHVLRDGHEREVTAQDVVVGDVLVLRSGDRLVADARVLRAQGLEVDESTLTGESLPVAKDPVAGRAGAHVVLDGSGVTAGAGQAVAVAVGRGTRLGATAAALAETEPPDSPLSRRLTALLRSSLPVIVVGGAIVAAAGLARGGALTAQLALGAGAAIAAVPEGLPLMAGVAEAGVATRLADHGALVRRPAAVETLGRVDVACFDKTGTLTEGRLAARRVADLDGESLLSDPLPERLRAVLAVAAAASPRPDEHGALAHATDAAVVQAAAAAGLAPGDVRPDAESPFASARGFHATRTGREVAVKGAIETVLGRCTSVARAGGAVPLDAAARAQMVALAERLAAGGLRVLLVARGWDTGVDDPQGLEALGFVGLSDPLRAGTAAAVDRCHRAGIRLVMLTGDHPATARTIAQEAGLALNGHAVLTGDEISGLGDAELDRRLAEVEVVARITPVDKLRIVESLQRQGRTVAMTGDGVNDAPALRLADVGVALGSGATEVARQAADLVIPGDELDSMVEALVEGRGFWQNLRRALALLLGGNLGEIALIAGAAALGGTGSGALSTRQVLTVNLVTDVLPALAVAVQPPEHRDLSALAREGTAALDVPLRDDILRRGAATAAPSLAAFVAAGPLGAPPATVAFGSVVGAQLAQTVDVGRAEGRLSPSVAAAIAASTGVMVTALAAGPVRAFLGLAAPTPAALLLILAASGGAVVVSRLLAAPADGAARRPQAPTAPAPALA